MSLRVIGVSEAKQAVSKAKRLSAMMRECIAANPNTVLLIWEADADLAMRCEPMAPAVAVGMVQLAKQLLRGDL